MITSARRKLRGEGKEEKGEKIHEQIHDKIDEFITETRYFCALSSSRPFWAAAPEGNGGDEVL